jgi:predicted kinase
MKPMTLATPHLIIIVGIPGSGKTFFAEHFATTFNAPFVSVAAIVASLDANLGQDSAVTISNYMLKELLKTGQTVVYDGIVDSRTMRAALAKIAKDKGYSPLLVWVQTESASAKVRATKPRKDAPYLTSEEFENALRRFTPPNASEKAVVISGKHTYPSQLKIVLKRLALGRAQRVDDQPVRAIEGRHIAVR